MVIDNRVYHGYKQGTEELLKREASIKDDDVRPQTSSQSETDVSHALAAYKRF